MKKIAQYFFGVHFSGLDIKPCDAIKFDEWYEATHHDVTQMQLEAAYEAAKWVWNQMSSTRAFAIYLQGSSVCGYKTLKGVTQNISKITPIIDKIAKQYDLEVGNAVIDTRGTTIRPIINDTRDICLVIEEVYIYH